MTQKELSANNTIGGVRWLLFYGVLVAILLLLAVSTVLWVENSRAASEETVNNLVEFYLEEIAERNAGSITSELKKKADQDGKCPDGFEPGLPPG